MKKYLVKNEQFPLPKGMAESAKGLYSVSILILCQQVFFCFCHLAIFYPAVLNNAHTLAKFLKAEKILVGLNIQL